MDELRPDDIDSEEEADEIGFEDESEEETY